MQAIIEERGKAIEIAMKMALLRLNGTSNWKVFRNNYIVYRGALMNSRTFSKCIEEGYYLASNKKMITWGNDSIKIFPTKKLALKFLIDEREWFKKQGLTPEDFEIKLCWVVAEEDCVDEILK